MADAVRYLNRRRLLYPWLFVGLTFVPFGSGQGLGSLAELIATRLHREGRERVATLAPRGLFDIASQYVLIAYAVIVVTGLVRLVVDLRIGQVPALVVSVAAVAVVVGALAGYFALFGIAAWVLKANTNVVSKKLVG